MRLLANVIWLILTGWAVGLVYLLGSLILLPLAPFLWPLVKFSFWPFGKEAVANSALRSYQEANGMDITEDAWSRASGTVRFLGNVVWVFTFGWILALCHLAGSIINLCFFWLIITIPNISGHFKLISVAFRPFGRNIVSKELADEINLVSSRKKILKQ